MSPVCGSALRFHWHSTPPSFCSRRIAIALHDSCQESPRPTMSLVTPNLGSPPSPRAKSQEPAQKAPAEPVSPPTPDNGSDGQSSFLDTPALRRLIFWRPFWSLPHSPYQPIPLWLRAMRCCVFSLGQRVPRSSLRLRKARSQMTTLRLSCYSLSRQDSLWPRFPAFRPKVGDASRCAWTERKGWLAHRPSTKGDIPNEAHEDICLR